jgi:predicted DNA-binding ribbon-helix-helix protein
MMSSVLHFAADCSVLPDFTRTMARQLRSHRVSVSLTEEERKSLERIAERSALSISRVVQEAVREFVKGHSAQTIDVLRK